VAECPFISVLFEPQTNDATYTKAKLKGFTIQYFASFESTEPITFTDYKDKQVDHESIQDVLDVDNPSALFLTPVPLGATIARLVPEDLKFHVGGKGGKFATLPLIDLSASSQGTGFYLFDESTEPPPIPEPALLGLLGLGALVAGRRARRR
jgi:MYXO-CTERM domain-containing protein